jgi:membrane-associated phospholipid phosphatase
MTDPPTTAADAATRRWRHPAIAVAAVAAVLLIALTWAVEAKAGWLADLDRGTADGLNRVITAHPGQAGFWKAVTNVGGGTFWRIAALVTAVALWLRGYRRRALYTVVAVGGTSALSVLGKALIGRTRPHVAHPVIPDPGGLSAGSYPSGHALTSAVAVGVAVVLVRPYLGRAGRAVAATLAAAVAALIGFSRLILGVHYVSDVVAGWLVAVLWLLGVTALFAEHPRVATLSVSGSRLKFRP